MTKHQVTWFGLNFPPWGAHAPYTGFMVKKKYQPIFGLLLNTIYVYLIQRLNLSPNLTFPGLNIGTKETSLTQEEEGTSVSALAQLSLSIFKWPKLLFFHHGCLQVEQQMLFLHQFEQLHNANKNRDLTAMNLNSCTQSTFLAALGTWDY